MKLSMAVLFETQLILMLIAFRVIFHVPCAAVFPYYTLLLSKP